MKPEPINRVELLSALEVVAPALSPKDVLAQSASFIFRGGWVATFDNECYIRTRCNMPKDFKMAVFGKPLLETLRKLPDEKVDLEIDKGRLVVIGEKDEIEVQMSETILLPIGEVEKAAEWEKVHDEYGEAMKAASACAGKDEGAYLNTMVQVCPDHVQGTDGFHLARYSTKSIVSDSVLVRATSAKVVGRFTPIEMSESAHFLHYGSADGAVLSVRSVHNDWHDVDDLPELHGPQLVLPKALIASIDLTNIFAAEYSEDIKVTVSIKKNELTLRGLGVSGKAAHYEKIKYDGPPVEFNIPPTIFSEMIKKHSECEIVTKGNGDEAKPMLIVRVGGLFYLAVAETPRRAKKKETAAAT